MIVFGGISLKLEKVGPTISSFWIHIHPCHPLQQRTLKGSMPNHSLKSQNWTVIFRIQLMWRHRPLKGNPSQSWIVDSIPWIQDSRHWIPDSNQEWDSGFLDLYYAFQSPRFQNPQIFPGFWILDSTSKNFLHSRIQDCLGFWIPHPIFLIPVTGFYILCQWNWDSVQSLVGFWIPWAVFRILKPRIPDSTNQIFLIPDCTNKIFPDSQIRISLHRTKDRF